MIKCFNLNSHVKASLAPKCSPGQSREGSAGYLTVKVPTKGAGCTATIGMTPEVTMAPVLEVVNGKAGVRTLAPGKMVQMTAA